MFCHGKIKLLTRLDFAVLSVCVSGHVNVLKWLNAKGDISSTDTLGGSPLHDAAEQGQLEVSKLLKWLHFSYLKVLCVKN